MWRSVTRRGRMTLERRLLPVSNGLITLEQTFTGSDLRIVVTHSAFVLASVEVLEGRLSFPLASGIVEAPNRFTLAVPPYSLLPMLFEDALLRSHGVAGFLPIVTEGPALLDSDIQGVLRDIESVQQAARGRLLKALSPDAGVSPSTVRARQLLHELIAHPAPLRSAAKQVGVSAESLSRSFSRAYGIGPKEYCHRARLFEAALRLMSGATILQAAFDAGFSDLKRFYVQFKRLLGTTPGDYVQVKKRQDSRLKDRI